MANLDLSQFAAAGVYVVEVSAAIAPVQVDSQRLRIIVGFSKKGPKNTLVYLGNKSDALKIYGDIDTYLEKRGSYFHRALYTALDAGPVLALNLLPVNNDTVLGDKIEYTSFSVDTAAKNANVDLMGNKLKYLFSGFFNKERFWKADEEYFENIVKSNALSENKYFSITNVGNAPVTILTRKGTDVPRDFNISVSEYFGMGNEPAIAMPFDDVADYFVDVIVISGKWDNYTKLAADPIYGIYFDSKGLKKDYLDSFLSADGVNVVATYTGSLFPELLDNNNQNQSIDFLVNKDYVQTGVFVTLNEKAFEDYDVDVAEEHIDLVGHNLIGKTQNKINYLSYNSIIDNLAVIEREDATLTDRFEFTQEDVTNLTTDVLGYNPESVIPVPSTTQDYCRFDMAEISVELDLTDASDEPLTFTDDSYLYVDLGDKYILRGFNDVTDNGNITGQVAKNDADEILFFEDYYKLNELGVKANITSNILTFTVDETEMDLFYPGASTKYTYVGTPASITTASNIFLYNNTGTTPPFTKLTLSDVDNTGGDLTITIGDTYSDGDYYIIIEPKIFTDVDIYKGRKDAMIINGESMIGSEGTNLEQLLIIGPEHPSYTNIEDVTDEKTLITAGNEYDTFSYTDEYLTDNDFIINDTGKAYKLVRLDSLDGTIVLKDSVTVQNSSTQGAGIEWILSNGVYSIKLDMDDTSKIYDDFLITSTVNANTFIVSELVSNNLNVGDKLKSTYDGREVLSKITEKEKIVNGDVITFSITTSLPYVVTTIENTTTEYYVTRYYNIDTFVDNYNLFTLSGFTFTTYHLPDGTDEQMSKIYDVLDPQNTNLREILSERDIIDWRYIVDTFSGGIMPNMGGKSQLSKVAKSKGQGLALLNAPSMTQFANSTNPIFTNPATVSDPKPIINSDYIKTGGNLNLGPTNKFSIPDMEIGGKYTGVFGPYLRIVENSKNKIVPPAADISNNFIRKFALGQPYAIVAGEPLGVISNSKLIGVEYDLLTRDRVNFEAIGINPIVNKNNVVKIFGNLTAYQRTVTPLNSLHVRDLLISIENTLINISSSYLFRKNTAAVRLEIQTIVETYLETVLTDGGLTAFNVKIDGENNTNAIIDQRVAILDVEVIPAMGMEKFVNRVTIYNNTGAAATGF